VGFPDQLPVLPVSDWPCCAVPEIEGAAVFDGGGCCCCVVVDCVVVVDFCVVVDCVVVVVDFCVVVDCVLVVVVLVGAVVVVVADVVVAAAATTGDCGETAVADPPAFEAVTATRRVAPTSAFATEYRFAVAPLIVTQFAPVESQRRHW
jgi:hypothetical protein